MKFLSYKTGGRNAFGAVRDDGRIVNLTQSHGLADLAHALRNGGPEQLLALARSTPASDLTLEEIECYRPVVADAERIFCVGLNYEEHRIEVARERTQHPTIFLRLGSSQTGHLHPLVIPKELPEGLDFEGEIAVVIGIGGRRIAKEDAWQHVFGYAPYNDASARSWQAHSTQWTAGKNFPSTGAFGPVLVQLDETPDKTPLTLTTRLNGEVVQHADTSMMIFSIPALIAYISTFTELMPGDVIVTGTPGGVGFKRTPQLLMQAGDLVEVEVGGVGVLSNRVVAERSGSVF